MAHKGNGLNGHGRGGKREGAGRLPRGETKKLERDYFHVAKQACTHAHWRKICELAVADAMGVSDDITEKGRPVIVSKARDFLLKALSLEQALKVQVSGSLVTPPAYTDDLAKILGDPEATARLLDAVQGPSSVPALSVEPTNGNGNGAGHDPLAR